MSVTMAIRADVLGQIQRDRAMHIVGTLSNAAQLYEESHVKRQ